MTTNIVPLKSGGAIQAIIPTDVEQVFRLATAISKSGLAPSTMKDPEKLVVAIMHGLEIGLPPMQSVQRIAVINGRPAIWGDALPALLWAKGFKLIEEMVDISDSSIAAKCTVVRPDGERITRIFADTDAKKAGLLGKPGPWQQYPARMLQMRARGFACRDGAADVLAGLYVAEELADAPELIESSPKRKSSNAAKKDGQTVPLFNEIIASMQRCETADDLQIIADTYAQEIEDLPKSWAEIVKDTYEFRMKDLNAEVVEVIE
jgi:hypothetical protein